jgi:thiamine-phosphate pyrophosphorylase
MIIGKKIKNICKKNKVKFIINDDPFLAVKLNADGCHLGQKDMNIRSAKKILGKKIIGITCHNSINLAKKAIRSRADYIAFGAFNQSKTKKTKYLASVNILNKVKKFTKTPIVAIGGIDSVNYKNLLLNNANFLAISGYIWKNKKYKPLQAIERLK